MTRVELQRAVEVPQSLGGILHLDVYDGQVVPQIGVGAVQLQRSQVGVLGLAGLVHLQQEFTSGQSDTEKHHPETSPQLFGDLKKKKTAPSVSRCCWEIIGGEAELAFYPPVTMETR